MSVRQVWKRKTSTPKSSPSSQKDSPPLHLRVNFKSPSPPSYNPLRDQMINQLHNISTILDSHTNPPNAYIHVLPSPPPQPIHHPSHAQVESHSSFCHCCNGLYDGGEGDLKLTLRGSGEKFGWWFEQDIGGENKDDNDKKLMMRVRVLYWRVGQISTLCVRKYCVSYLSSCAGSELGSELTSLTAAGSDTRPSMLDRTDYDSWSQRIRLYFKGKENEIYILQLIDHGPFELETTRDTLDTTPEGGVLLRPERPRTYDDLNDNEKKRFNADVRATNIVL
nr:integrase, catalytic region, zinc finger, CCHC-type, peptidase aspartic, catalytic [Tanacetum cinerariifolium]